MLLYLSRKLKGERNGGIKTNPRKSFAKYPYKSDGSDMQRSRNWCVGWMCAACSASLIAAMCKMLPNINDLTRRGFDISWPGRKRLRIIEKWSNKFNHRSSSLHSRIVSVLHITAVVRLHTPRLDPKRAQVQASPTIHGKEPYCIPLMPLSAPGIDAVVMVSQHDCAL
jgi:hypothetical protein